MVFLRIYLEPPFGQLSILGILRAVLKDSTKYVLWCSSLFLGGLSMLQTNKKQCQECGYSFDFEHPSKRYCNRQCKQKAHRQRMVQDHKKHASLFEELLCQELVQCKENGHKLTCQQMAHKFRQILDMPKIKSLVLKLYKYY